MTESPFLQVVERYHRLKGLLPELQNRLLTALDDEVAKSLLNQAGARLGLLVDGQVAASAQYEIATIADHAFYDLLHDGKTAIERFVQTTGPITDPDEAALLTGLGESRWALLQVIAPDPGVGIIASDMIDSGTRVVIAPEAAEIYGPDQVLAMRVVRLVDLAFPSSGVMPIDPASQQRIFQGLDERFPYRKRRGMSGLTANETADFNAILANAALDAMATYLSTMDDILGELDEPDDHHQSVKADRPPLGQRPKAPGKAKKKQKRR